MKSIKIILSITLFILLYHLPVFSEQLPLKSIPEFIQFEDKFEPYYPMKCRLKKQKTILIGNYWHQKFRHAAVHDENTFYGQLTSINPKMKLVDKGHSIRLYTLQHGKDTYWIKIDFNSKWYDVKAILKKPYKHILKLNDDGDLLYSPRIDQKLPNHIILPRIEGYHIDQAEYKDLNMLKLHYKTEKNKKVEQSFEGRYWNLTYQRIQNNDENQRYQLIHNFSDEITRLGGVIFRKKNSSIVFKIDTTTGEMWGKVSSLSSSIHLECVEIDTFDQSLILTSEEIKAELNKSGKVILYGIYFDTAKTVLKPQSKSAIDAVVDLMKRYPDLKIEIQGYTDSSGSMETNLSFSEERAAAVKKALIKAGIQEDRLVSIGFGELHPISSNETIEGRSENRRIELHHIGVEKVKNNTDAPTTPSSENKD